MLTSLQNIKLSTLVVIIGLCLGAEKVLAQQELRQAAGLTNNNRVVLELPTINFTRLYNEVNLSRLYSRLFNSTREKPVEQIPLEPEPEPIRPQKHRNLSPYPYLQLAQPQPQPQLNGYYANPVLATFATQQRTPSSSNVGTGKQIFDVKIPSSTGPQELINSAYHIGQGLVQSLYNSGYPYGLDYGSGYGAGYVPGYSQGFPSGFGYRPAGPAGPGGFYIPESVLPLTADFIQNLNRDLPGVTVQTTTGNAQITNPSYLNYRRRTNQFYGPNRFGSQFNSRLGIQQQLLQAQLAQQALAQEEGLDYAEDGEAYGDDYDNYDGEGDYGYDEELWRKAETDTKTTTKANRNKSDKKIKNSQNKKRQQTKQRSKRVSY